MTALKSHALAFKLDFEIAGLPRTPNELSGGHWRKRSNNTQTWRSAVWSKAWAHQPKEPLRKAKVVLTRFSSRAMDEDNLVASFKPLLDGLVRAGILLDDKREVVTLECRQEKAPRGCGKVRVEVYEVRDEQPA